MNTLKLFIIFSLILPLLFACATPRKDIATLPSFKLAEATLTKRLYIKDTTAVPIEPTLTFTIETDVETLPEITKRADSKSWGLIIGIDKYPALPSVDYAENDSNLMKTYFIKILGASVKAFTILLSRKAPNSRLKGYIRGYIPKNV